MSTLATKRLTADEFFDLPEPIDGSKEELVKGEVVTMPAPTFKHGEVQGNVYFAIKSFAKSTRLGRVVVESGVPTERDEDEGDTVRGPDVSYYSKERLPLGQDLCVEVLSPSNTKRELREKIKEYFAAGVRMVWIVEPEDRSVTVMTQPGQGQAIYEPGELLGGEVLPGFSCPISELFE
jgi:Uma2 family endonuclease